MSQILDDMAAGFQLYCGSVDQIQVFRIIPTGVNKEPVSADFNCIELMTGTANAFCINTGKFQQEHIELCIATTDNAFIIEQLHDIIFRAAFKGISVLMLSAYIVIEFIDNFIFLLDGVSAFGAVADIGNAETVQDCFSLLICHCCAPFRMRKGSKILFHKVRVLRTVVIGIGDFLIIEIEILKVCRTVGNTEGIAVNRKNTVRQLDCFGTCDFTQCIFSNILNIQVGHIHSIVGNFRVLEQNTIEDNSASVCLFLSRKPRNTAKCIAFYRAQRITVCYCVQVVAGSECIFADNRDSVQIHRLELWIWGECIRCNLVNVRLIVCQIKNSDIWCASGVFNQPLAHNNRTFGVCIVYIRRTGKRIGAKFHQGSAIITDRSQIRAVFAKIDTDFLYILSDGNRLNFRTGSKVIANFLHWIRNCNRANDRILSEIIANFSYRAAFAVDCNRRRQRAGCFRQTVNSGQLDSRSVAGGFVSKGISGVFDQAGRFCCIRSCFSVQKRWYGCVGNDSRSESERKCKDRNECFFELFFHCLKPPLFVCDENEIVNIPVQYFAEIHWTNRYVRLHGFIIVSSCGFVNQSTG